MKNMNDKTKKGLIIAGGILLSIVLIFMISTRFQKEPVTDTVATENSAGSGEVIVDGSTTEPTEQVELSVPSIEITESPQNDTGADDTGTEQTIQAEIPEKPIYTEEQLSDPTQKPDGEKVDPPKEEDSTPAAPPEAVTPTEQKPSGGLPGFDSVPDGGSNQVISGESDGDINTPVGTMD